MGGGRPGPPGLHRAHQVTVTPSCLWLGGKGWGWWMKPNTWPDPGCLLLPPLCPVEQEAITPCWGAFSISPAFQWVRVVFLLCPLVGMTHRAPQAVAGRGCAHCEPEAEPTPGSGLVPGLGLDSWTLGPGSECGTLASGCGGMQFLGRFHPHTHQARSPVGEARADQA